MTVAITSVQLSPLTPLALPADAFAQNLREIPDPAPILSAFGFAAGDELYGSLPAVVQGGVQSATAGAIQDPAGSAVGRSFAGAGGASGAIYRHFNNMPDTADHLAPIPAIDPCAAVFNASAGAGRRVLHTHSPSLRDLALDPAKDIDRGRALSEIGNAYYNAIAAFNARSADLGRDGQLLNLVPVSGKIYCGDFINSRSDWGDGVTHLDPTYTLSAILLALAQLHADGDAIPQLALYYFEKAVCATAAAEVAKLRAG